MDGSLFGFSSEKVEPPVSFVVEKKEVFANENLGFLSLFKEKIPHHCLLISDIYSFQNNKILLEFLSVKHQKSVQEMTAHPDFLFYTEFAQKQLPIKVEDARDIISFAQNTGFSGTKVIVVNKIDEATPSALNCLLKIIEEPPVNTFFYFIYSNEKRLPATVRSRSVILHESISNEENFFKITQFFEEQANFQIFIQSGYNFHIYRKLLAVQNFSFFQVKKKLGEKLDEEFIEQTQVFLEKTLNRMATLAKNFDEINEIHQITQRLLFLRKSVDTLNTNKQLALMEVADKIHLILQASTI
jgi:DNA polymerase III delta prime subunit